MSNVNIRNKKAWHNYEILEKFEAGLQLYGTEIKAIRQTQASLSDSFCHFIKGELYANFHISEYSHGTYSNHEPKRERKLLMHRRELDKLESKVATKGLTIVPLRLFINNSGIAKLEIALVRGKKTHDKREDLKEKDAKREMARMKKLDA